MHLNMTDTTVYLNKLIHGCHSSTNDPEKFFKAWGVTET